QRILYSFLCALCVFVVFFLPVRISAQYQGMRITRVSVLFEGVTEAPEQGEFLDVIDIRPGEEYSAVKIREAILKLYRSGRASFVQVQAKTTAGGVELLFTLRRQLRVGEVKFSGTQIFTE